MASFSFSALKSRDLRLYLIGSFISFVGSYMQVVGIAWHIYVLTHSAFSLGFLGIVGFLPTLLAFLPAGVMVDKHHKKTLILISEFLLGIFALVLFAATTLSLINIWIIFSMLFLSSLIGTIEGPSRQATVAIVASQENLSQALSLQTLSRQMGAVIGPALAGFCIALYGVQSIYLLNAFSFFFFFLMILFMQIPRVTAQIESTKGAIVEGIRFLKNNSLIGISMFFDFFANFFAGAMILLPVFAKDIYHVNAQGLGLLYAGPSIGAVISGFYFASQTKLFRPGLSLIVAVAIYAIGTIGFGLSKDFWLGFFFLVIIGAGDMVSTVVRSFIRQNLTPDNLRGRVMAIGQLFYSGGPFLGDAEAGFVAGFLGAPASVVVGGILTLILSLGIGFKSAKLREYK